eukprot:TRINITY_DN12909_c1_g3_i1.p2 TRINITY_DN12909_c1_g3~~TRINITY_DN12909_c1_g3_i1.p2  ORF type:complete len:324 (-),score=50.90 TRINITY_DN12909_c1_g3_i1:230-1114(-)
MSGEEKQPLIGGDEVTVDIPEDGKQQEAPAVRKSPEQLCREALWFSFTNIPAAIVILCCILSIIFFVLDFVLAGYFFIWLGIVAIVGTGLGSGTIISLGGMSRQLDRFKNENDRLEKTSTMLTRQVSTLEETNDQLTGQVDQLQETVGSLKAVSDGLNDQLKEFDGLKQNLEVMAKKTGQNVQELLGQSATIYKKIQSLTVENERVLLERIAQDLEFLDRDAGMSKNEFERFVTRIPNNLQEKFKSLGVSFEELAGEDKVVDYGEIQALINGLMTENSTKKGVLASARQMENVK